MHCGNIFLIILFVTISSSLLKKLRRLLLTFIFYKAGVRHRFNVSLFYFLPSKPQKWSCSRQRAYSNSVNVVAMVNENETKIATTAFAADLMHFRVIA